MKRLLAICAIAGFVWVTCGTAAADDLYPPTWRGGPNTVYAHWTFSYNQMPNDWIPEFEEPPGMAIIQLHGDTEWLPEYAGRNGVIYSQFVEIQAYNFENPDNWKLIYLQITWHLSGDPPGLIESFPGGEVYLMEDFDLENDWHYSRYGIEIFPNPDFEVIHIPSLTGAPMFIDQIVFDSWCVPEPAGTATLALASMATLGLLWRRRRA